MLSQFAALRQATLQPINLSKPKWMGASKHQVISCSFAHGTCNQDAPVHILLTIKVHQVRLHMISTLHQVTSCSCAHGTFHQMTQFSCVHGTFHQVTSFYCAHGTFHQVQGFFQPFWEGALGPFASGNFRYFNRNWENSFNHFYMVFLNRDPKTALNYSYSWLYALF